MFVSLEDKAHHEMCCHVAEMLNTEDTSFLKGRVKTSTLPRAKSGMSPLIDVSRLSCLIYRWWKKFSRWSPYHNYVKNVDDIYNFFNSYLSAMRKSFPMAWGNNDSFMMTESIGFGIMFSICDQITTYIFLRDQKMPATEDFVNFINAVFYEGIMPAGIRLDGDNEIPFNWNKETFKKHASKMKTAELHDRIEKFIIKRCELLENEHRWDA